jgi:hypothetical protein
VGKGASVAPENGELCGAMFDGRISLNRLVVDSGRLEE